MDSEPVGVVGWAEVKRHGRTLYVRLSELDIQIHDIRPGDKLKVEVHSIIKGVREQARRKTHEEKTD